MAHELDIHEIEAIDALEPELHGELVSRCIGSTVEWGMERSHFVPNDPTEVLDLACRLLGERNPDSGVTWAYQIYGSGTIYTIQMSWHLDVNDQSTEGFLFREVVPSVLEGALRALALAWTWQPAGTAPVGDVQRVRGHAW